MPVLKWNAAAGGYIATGFYDWDACDYVSVYVIQGPVVAWAQGPPHLDSISDDTVDVGLSAGDFNLPVGTRTWQLTTALKEIDGPELQNGHAFAGAVGVMRSGSQRAIKPWTQTGGLLLQGKP